EVGGSQLPGQEPRAVGLIEPVQEIGGAPDTENPRDDHTCRTWQQQQRKQREYRGNDVAIGRGLREGSRQVGRHDAWDHECQPEEAEAVQEEPRPQRVLPPLVAEFRPYVTGGDYPPGDEAECDACEKAELRLHEPLLPYIPRVRTADSTPRRFSRMLRA